MRMFRNFALVSLLVGLGAITAPSHLTAATCTADNGAECVCSGPCGANSSYCWCEAY